MMVRFGLMVVGFVPPGFCLVDSPAGNLLPSPFDPEAEETGLLDAGARTEWAESSLQDIPQPNKTETHASPPVSVTTYALAGGAAYLLLSVIEWVDLNIQLTPHFDSFLERAILSAYLSVNILVGLVVGLLAGLFAHAAAFSKSNAQRALARGDKPSTLHRLVAWSAVAAAAAILLNQQPHINGYVIGLIREAEKFSSLRTTLLNHERSASYLIVMALVVTCTLVWTAVRSSHSLNNRVRLGCLVSLAGLIAVAYYIDSRVERQLYEYTFHRTMYLLNIGLAMAAAGILLPFFRVRRIGKTATVVAAVALVLLLAFTFVHFGKNQSIKTHLFYRATQAKQNLKLVWWALDFDRDGYSAVLDGGDGDDSRSDINPGQLEVVGDGVDNNGIGGSLTQQDVDEWRTQHDLLGPNVPAAAGPFNVVFVFIDTVRADHLSAYGYGRETSPNLDRLGARATVFENAFSPSPRTSEAVPKFMQSCYWDGHLESWTQVLTRNGYDTKLFPGRRSWSRYKKWMPVVKKAQGKPLEQNIDVAIEVLAGAPANRPFCAFVYVPDPHRPYVKRDEFYYGASLADLYDGELRYTDSHLGRLFDWMEKAGRFDDTIVVIMSDHGESLGERGVNWHSTQLYSEQVHVPMIVYIPHQTPRRVADYVSTIDLGSTILGAVGIERPKQYVGVNLMPWIRGDGLTRPPVFGEQTSQEVSQFVRLDQQVHPESKKYMTITQDGYKLIYNRDVNSFELYDLKNDPPEQHNLYDRFPEKAQMLRELVGRFVDIVTASRPAEADEGRYSRVGGRDGDKVEE
ncbi:MAG: sulfatase [Blastocatellia bacterium]